MHHQVALGPEEMPVEDDVPFLNSQGHPHPPVGLEQESHPLTCAV